MLNDGTGFKKVYLATGFTDLRRGIDGLAKNHTFSVPARSLMIVIHYSYFAVSVPNRIKGLIWKVMDFSFCISGLKMGTSDGLVHRRKRWRSAQTSIEC